MWLPLRRWRRLRRRRLLLWLQRLQLWLRLRLWLALAHPMRGHWFRRMAGHGSAGMVLAMIHAADQYVAYDRHTGYHRRAQKDSNAAAGCPSGQ